jgi:hypothetical protein
MLKQHRYFILILLTAIPLALFLPKGTSVSSINFHTVSDLRYFGALLDSLPMGFNDLFAGSGECVACHGMDTAGIASVDLGGNDINVVDDWRATMMANAAKDPFWRAKVSHEVLENPQVQQEIESTCTKCHAPLGNYNAQHNGQAHYSIAEMVADSIALDGVSCLACHQQRPEMLGDTHSGTLNFDTAKVAYGPYSDPLHTPMALETGYAPVYSEHISDAGICAGCHTLITSTVDPDDGSVTPNTFVEQATYHEWLNSSYNTTDDISCQKCHMPTLAKGSVFIAAGYETEPRAPFSLHTLTGANAFMLQLMRDNREALGINADLDNFEETIASTYDMLQNRSIRMDMEPLERTGDTAFVMLTLENKTGHKFPSGYPSRRAFLKVSAITPEGDIIFQSGNWDDTYEVNGQDPVFEPHYQTIRSEGEVQIYEMVVADNNGNRTTILEYMSHHMKDNRLTPKGFTTTAEVYDTVAIVGAALSDPDFNKEEGMEGTGKDKIYYNIPLNGHGGELIVTAEFYYQTAPPRWMEEMFAVSTPEIETFRTMFQNADKAPILIDDEEVVFGAIVATHNLDPTEKWIKTLTVDRGIGMVTITSSALHDLKVFDVSGKLIHQAADKSGHYSISLGKQSGIFIFHFVDKKGNAHIEKIYFY